jgi:hypothetical protein
MPSWIGIELWRDPQKRRNNLMNKVFIAMCTPALLTAISFGQSAVQAQAGDSAPSGAVASANASGATEPSQTAAGGAAHAVVASGTSQSPTLAAGSAIHATLAKPVDARHSKPGDQVMAKTTENVNSDGQVVLPKGSKIVGHVTEAKTYSRGASNSELGMAFDYAVLKDGREVPLAASIQAIASPEASSPADQGDNGPGDNGTMAAGSAGAKTPGGNAAGGVLAGSSRAVGTTSGTLLNTSSPVGPVRSGTLEGASSASGGLSSSSHGAIGLKGISLDSAANSATRGSVISCTSQNVHLDAGTQMILKVDEK